MKQPRLVVTLDVSTRLFSVVVRDWEGVSPGMMAGLELAIEKAIHGWKSSRLAEVRQEEAAANDALREQAGDGRVTSENIQPAI